MNPFTIEDEEEEEEDERTQQSAEEEVEVELYANRKVSRWITNRICLGARRGQPLLLLTLGIH